MASNNELRLTKSQQWPQWKREEHSQLYVSCAEPQRRRQWRGEEETHYRILFPFFLCGVSARGILAVWQTKSRSLKYNNETRKKSLPSSSFYVLHTSTESCTRVSEFKWLCKRRLTIENPECRWHQTSSKTTDMGIMEIFWQQSSVQHSKELSCPLKIV